MIRMDQFNHTDICSEVQQYMDMRFGSKENKQHAFKSNEYSPKNSTKGATGITLNGEKHSKDSTLSTIGFSNADDNINSLNNQHSLDRIVTITKYISITISHSKSV